MTNRVRHETGGICASPRVLANHSPTKVGFGPDKPLTWGHLFLHPVGENMLIGQRDSMAENAPINGYWYHLDDGQEDTEDANGLRDSRTNAERVLRESEEDREAAEALNSEGPPEEVASQTAPARLSGGCTAKRTRLGSPEDA